MARPRKNTGPHIYWKLGASTSRDWREGARAYADLRTYADVGGGRCALAEPGATWATTDPDIALVLFEGKLAELKAKRANRVGVPQRRSSSLTDLVRHHLLMKAQAGRTSDSHLSDLETRLAAALDFFGHERDPRTIEPADVRRWADELARSGRRGPGTVRHYLNALSGLYGRAQEGLYVDPGYNPVAMLREKPSGYRRSEAAFFEVHDAALLLEAARILQRQDRGPNTTPGLYPIIATFLLTGGRSAEVLGLDVDDVSFDRGLVHIRPNAHRGLKTSTSVRTVPLHPQLREILQAWMYGGDSPRTAGRLFTGPGGSRVGDLRKSLDAMGALCGFEPGEVRTRRFRHTYCSARLQTVQRIIRPGADPAKDSNPYEWIEVSRFTVQKEMGHGGAQLVNRIYGHAPRSAHRSEVVEYRVEKHREELGERLAVLTAAAATT